MRIIFISFIIGLISVVFAAQSSGFIKKLNGQAEILRNNKVIEVKIGDKIFQKDTIKTKSKSSVGIIFKDNTLISLGSNTEFSVEEYIFEPAEKNQSFVSNIKKGTMTCLTGLMSKLNPNAMKIKAKSATIGIRGTHFSISVD